MALYAGMIHIMTRHPNVIQIFGICESPHFLAIIFHGGKY